MTDELKPRNCKCGASAVAIGPTEWNGQSGYRVRCIMKCCNEQTAEYTRRRNAVRAWNRRTGGE